MNTRLFGMEDQRCLRGSLFPTTIPSPATGVETKLRSLRSHSDDPVLLELIPLATMLSWMEE
jgi:hypothetical protein